MPMKWTPPELFLVHNGVAVWRAYNDGAHESPYIFTTVESNDDVQGIESETEGQFDYRKLPTYTGPGNNQREVIKAAIDAGHFKDHPCDPPPRKTEPDDRWVVEHEFDNEPTYVVKSNLRESYGDEGCIVLGAKIPADERRALAKVIADHLNGDTTKGTVIACYIEGGVLQDVTASHPNVDVILIDEDNYECEDDDGRARIDANRERAESECPHPVY